MEVHSSSNHAIPCLDSIPYNSGPAEKDKAIACSQSSEEVHGHDIGC